MDKNKIEKTVEELSDDDLSKYDKVIKKIGDNEFIFYINKSSSSSSTSESTTESVEPSARIVTVDCLCKINRGIKECCNIF